MTRLTDIRQRVKNQGRYPEPVVVHADRAHLLDLVERAVPYMEQAADDDPHWSEQAYTAYLWLRDVRGEEGT